MACEVISFPSSEKNGYAARNGVHAGSVTPPRWMNLRWRFGGERVTVPGVEDALCCSTVIRFHYLQWLVGLAILMLFGSFYDAPSSMHVTLPTVLSVHSLQSGHFDSTDPRCVQWRFSLPCDISL